MIEMGKKSGAKYPFLVGLDPKQSDPYHLYPFQASFGAPVFELKDKGFDSSKVAMGGTNGEKFASWLAEQGDLGDPGPQRPGVLAARCGDTFFSGLAIDG